MSCFTSSTTRISTVVAPRVADRVADRVAEEGSKSVVALVKIRLEPLSGLVLESC